MVMIISSYAKEECSLICQLFANVAIIMLKFQQTDEPTLSFFDFGRGM